MYKRQEYTSVATALAALGIANLDNLLSREGMFKPAQDAKKSKKMKKVKKVEK